MYINPQMGTETAVKFHVVQIEEKWQRKLGMEAIKRIQFEPSMQDRVSSQIAKYGGIRMIRAKVMNRLSSQPIRTANFLVLLHNVKTAPDFRASN